MTAIKKSEGSARSTIAILNCLVMEWLLIYLKKVCVPNKSRNYI